MRAAISAALAVGLALFGVVTGTGTGPDRAAALGTTTPAPAWDAPHHGTVKGLITGRAARTGMAKAEQAFTAAHEKTAAAENAGDEDVPAPASEATTASTYVHKWWGVKLTTGSATVSGVQATHSVNSALRMTDASDYLYSPTTKPRQGACIESTTAYSKTYAQLWAYDWCASDPGIGVRLTIDSSFLSTYTTTVNGVASYNLQILQTDSSANTWTAYLYDYKTGAWETYYTSSGTDGGTATFGWDEFEFYSYLDTDGETYLCDGYAGHSSESSNLKIRTGTGTWADATTSNTTVYPSTTPSPSDYYCAGLDFTTVTANTHWKVSE
ncbi:hypothetical protein OG496_54310 [Streptomyces sp. NBC_00988]|uniref:hypothetical protein n=1 Tax=Streptomyces sp. NBC_00988 TaxID=2903704 RepID=UPI00386A6A00|nr:hypothetical protein OG496_54310 [Streptomyces sp. NBC_00988]